jgi:parvulin-like peptidyl-prolyl isomerase
LKLAEVDRRIGLALVALGRSGEAEPLLKQAAEVLTRAHGEEHAAVVEIQEALEKTARDAGRPVRPRFVGRYSRGDRLVFEGNTTFTPAILKKGLFGSSTFILAAHPAGKFEDYLGATQDCLLRGFANEGFPDAKVAVDYDAAQDAVRARLVEGRRYRWGTLKITGLKSLSNEVFLEQLVKQATAPDTFARRVSEAVLARSVDMALKDDPLSDERLLGDVIVVNTGSTFDSVWKAGDFASFGKSADGSIQEQVNAALWREGLVASGIEVSHTAHADSGLVDTVVKIDEGKRAVLKSITFIGNKRYARAELLRFLELEEGMAMTGRLKERVEDKLTRSLRFARWKVILKPLGPGKADVEMRIGLVEMPGAPPLDQPLTAEQEAFVNISEWITMLDRHDVSLSLALFGPDMTPKSMAMLWSASKGVMFRGNFETAGSPLQKVLLALNADYSLRALLQEAGEKQAWQTRLSLPNLVLSLHGITGVDEKGEAFSFMDGPKASFGNLADAGARHPLRLRLLISPTAIQDLFGSVEMKVEGDVLVWGGLRWDKKRQSLAEFVYTRFDPQTRQPSEFIVLRPDAESWKWGEEQLSEGLLNAKERKAGVSDWNRLLFQIPGIEGLLGDLITEDKVAGGALLLDLLSDSAGPLMTQFVNDTRQPFRVPMDLDKMGQISPTAGLMAELWFWLCDLLLPPDTWLWDLGRETFYAQAGHTEHTQVVMGRIAKSPDLGPLGCLLAEGILQRFGLPQAVTFRQLAWQKLSVEHFEKDWLLLMRSPSGLRDTLGRLLVKMQALDEPHIRLLADLWNKSLEPTLLDAVAQLRAQPGGEPAQLLWPLAKTWWLGSLEKQLRQSLEHTPGIKPADPAVVAARVNGVDITRAEVAQAAEVQEKMLRLTLREKPAELAQQLASLTSTTIESLIDREVVIQAFKKNGGEIKEEIVEEDLRGLVRDHFGGDRAAYEAELAKSGLTWDTFREMRRKMMIVQIMRGQIVNGVKEPTEAELREAYDREAAGGGKRAIHLHAITLHKAIGAATSGDQRKLAQEIRDKVIQGGDFEALAKAHSQDANAETGGCRGTVSADTLAAPLQEALTRMKAKDVSEVLEVEAFFVLLWIKEEKPQVRPPFDGERARLTEVLLGQRQKEAMDQWIRQQRLVSQIETFTR